MRRFITLLLLACLLAGCLPSGGASGTHTPLAGSPVEPQDESADYSPQPGDDAFERGPVYIEASHVYALEGFPPSYRLYLSGALPTPCHALRVAVAAPGTTGRIDVEAYALAEPDKMCAQVLKHFEATIRLEQLPPGQYSVWLNGTKTGDILVPASEDEAAPRTWELYSWEEGGVLFYALMEGAVTGYSLEEITAPENRLDSITAVRERLAQMRRGDKIVWRALDDATGRLPGKSVQQDLTAHAQNLGLQLQIWLPHEDETALKGWELYSWQENGAWQYALLAGTNRLKTWEEVTAQDVRLKDLTALKLALSRLAPGEFVIWQQGDFEQTGFPADAVVAEIQRYAAELGLNLQVVMLQ